MEKEKELSTSFYRNKYNDAKVYNQIKKAYLPYTTEARLKESLHLYDTQKNEDMNNSIAKYAPKTKRYGMTISLTNRVMIAIGVSNLGAEAYWKRVYLRLVIPMSPETISFLQNQDKYRSYRSTYAKKTEVKKHQTRDESRCRCCFEGQLNTRLDEICRDEEEDESENLSILWMPWKIRDNKSKRV